MNHQNPSTARILLIAVSLTLVVSGVSAAQNPDPAPQAPPAQPATALSGYMELHYNKRQFFDGELDFHRFVLLVTHRFSDRIRFVGELELEHAFVEGLEPAGELELEQAYVDFLLSRAFNVRAGMVLIPVGILNERHEPPVFYGVERTLVDTVIIPTTWFEPGVGVHGEVGNGWRYRAFLVAPLNAARFSAEEGLRDGRQKGSRANAGRLAVTGRLEYVGVAGLTIGASGWSGQSGAEFRPRFDVPVHLVEADVRYSRDRLELRAQATQVAVGSTADLNDALGRAVGVDPNIARRMRGAYVEAGYRVVDGARWGDVGVFARHEHANTQSGMAPGYLALPEFNRQAWTFGATYWPDADVAVKVDYSIMRNRSQVIAAPNTFNIGLGWWF